MKKVALYAGSFDPITIGHLNIIERASMLFDELVVCVVMNPNKKSLFTLEARHRMIEKCIRDLENVRIDSYEGLLADYVNAHKFDVVIRGLRNTQDFESEQQMANLNASLYKEGAETLFMMCDPKFSFISSSAVKEISLLGGDVRHMVPACIVSDIKHMEEK